MTGPSFDRKRPAVGEDLQVIFDCKHSGWFTPTEVRRGIPRCPKCQPTKATDHA